ncbi:hypothetical protein DVJ77_13805 [Dyella tabacisoli]|uniref:Uncharacterized protein n=2 Tax=Dyella tabacisoli TaxID=2282381 RepID=A0A369ULA4_9GAMM|nr:hypothetical protein DVJ77_13805 [Dyella tabacisoli]
MFLTAGEMTTAQNYLVNWLQLQNELLYTPGVLSGLSASNPSGNNLSVTTGAGFDGAGHFVILPEGAGTTITVPSTATNPSYLGLAYPLVPTPVNGMPYTVNMAGALYVANSIDQLPANSILLAQINIVNGGVDSLKDLRTPVDTRLPANLSSMEPDAAPSSRSAQSRDGVVDISGANLRKQGDSVSQVVYYHAQQTAAFDRIPQVFVTVRGNLPYATSVSDVRPAQFTLTLTAVLAPVADSAETISVNWLAYV